MNTAHCRLAVLMVLALAGVAALVPAAPAAPDAPPPTPAAVPRTPQSVFAGTAIGTVLEANDNELPRSGAEMMKLLRTFGEFAQLPVAFSAVDLHSGLTRPRVVITQRPSGRTVVARPRARENPLAIPAGFNGAAADDTAAVINIAAVNRPNLEGRLFLAANLEKVGGELKVKTLEFISWNSRTQKFDFGFIEFDAKEPQIRVVDGVRCFACHKNRGPILGQGPWSNTTHNDVVREAVCGSLGLDPKELGLPATLGQPTRLDTGFNLIGLRPAQGTADGMALLVPQGPAVDAGVRAGADLIRDREVYRAMARTADGRKGLAVLLGAIAAPGPLEQTGTLVGAELDRTFGENYNAFAQKWVSLHKASPNTLIDFNPAGPKGVLKNVTSSTPAGWGGGSTLQTNLRVEWTGKPKQATEYDEKRADGDHGLPSSRQPSSPHAFVKPTPAQPARPSAAVNATGLARVIGLTEGDRTFLAETLKEAATLIGKNATTAALAKEVFTGKQFTEAFTAGVIPDREDFKDRFVKGLSAVTDARGVGELPLNRQHYGSGPNVAPVPGEEKIEPAVVATTACLRCHDVRGADKLAFNPIPALAFDPFDTVGREAWAKATPAKSRVPALARMLKRLAEDRDMPPEDSAEYEQFRAKHPATFDTAKEWVEAELLKAK